MSETGTETLPPELESAVQLQAPPAARASLGPELARRLAGSGSTTVDALVVVGDLRMSALVLKEAIAPAAFARFVVGFTESVRDLIHDSDGWFDKFTGDGFIGFWLLPEPESFEGTRLARFCQMVLPAAEVLLRNLRRISRNFPAGTGLSLGVDAGPCELVRVGGSLTLVGGPIVGATRMVASASAWQTILNVYVGTMLERETEQLAAEGIRLERIVVKTKEFPEGQEAFRLLLPAVP